MFRDSDWRKLEKALQDCAPRGLTDPESDYLKKAFSQTERMWSENFAKVTKVRLVMLSEAPLFGAEAVSSTGTGTGGVHHSRRLSVRA
jgi:hypothetical protein